MLYMFQAVSPPIIRSSKTVHASSILGKINIRLGSSQSRYGYFEEKNISNKEQLIRQTNKETNGISKLKRTIFFQP